MLLRVGCARRGAHNGGGPDRRKRNARAPTSVGGRVPGPNDRPLGRRRGEQSPGRRLTEPSHPLRTLREQREGVRDAGHGDADDGLERGVLGAQRAPPGTGRAGAGRPPDLDVAGRAPCARPASGGVGRAGAGQARGPALRRQGGAARDARRRAGARRDRPHPLGGRPRHRRPLHRGRRRFRRRVLVDLQRPTTLEARLGRDARGDGRCLRPLHREGLGDHGPGGPPHDHR